MKNRIMYEAKYDIIIPSISDDVERVINLAERYLRFLGGRKIIIITNKTTIGRVKDHKQELVELMDEDSILPIKKCDLDLFFESRGIKSRRSGWYYQQFIKLGYAFLCKNKYYLVWDADTIPLRKICFFDENGNTLFNEKKEYHKPYFLTMEKILNIDKILEGSFITEHMMFQTDIVINMLKQIEINSNDRWFWKIMNCISPDALNGSGFSEYETYGTYVFKFYPTKCKVRNLKTLRRGGNIVSSYDYVDEKILDWLGMHYDTISFEKTDVDFHRDFVSKNKWITAILPSNIYVITKKIKHKFLYLLSRVLAK